MKSTVSRVAAAVSAVAALGLVAACGGGGESGDSSKRQPQPKTATRADASASDSASASSADAAGGVALTKAQLERATLASGDVKGYRIEKLTASDVGLDSVPAKPAECQPVADMLLFTTDPAARAAVGRSLAATDELDASSTSLALLSYGSGEAEQVLAALRTATGKCTAYEHTDYHYSGVKVLKDPGLGDESLSYRLLGSIEGASVPTAFTVVRVGTTVVSFTSMNMLDADKVKVPPKIIDAQLEKLQKTAQ